MLYQSQAEAAIQQSLIKAKFDAEKDRMEDAANRLAIYQDDYEDIIRETLSTLFCKENYARLQYHVNQSQNVLKRVVNEISMVYKAKASRTLDIESDRFDELQDEIGMDARMRRVNRLTNLLNEILVRPIVRSGRIVWDIITPDICTVIQDENDPTRIVAATWARTLANTMGSTLMEYEYMDDRGYWGILDSNFKPKSWYFTAADTPYRDAAGAPVLMLVPFHRQSPESEFWDSTSGGDLYNAAVGISWKLTLKDYYYKTSSFKQIYVIGSHIEIPDKQVSDPMTIFKILVDPQTRGEVGVLDLQNAIDKLLQSCDYDVKTIANNYGIALDQFTLETSPEMSGRALKIKNRALLEQRQEQEPTYRAGESELFDRTRILNNAHASFYGWQQIPVEAEFGVDFGEIEFPEDPAIELDLEAKKMRLGLLSLGQFAMKYNPDLTSEKEAEKWIMKNLEKLGKLREQSPALDEALNAIMGGAKASGDDTEDGQGNAQDRFASKREGA